MSDGESLPGAIGKERKSSSRITILAVIIAAILIVGSVGWLTVQSGSNKEPAPNGFTKHNRIIIDGNGAFTRANGVVQGNGTESNPYIIEGWYITTTSGGGISIADTTASFVVRSCFVRGNYLNESYGYSGITLMNCVNGKLVNNSCSDNFCGIWLSSSSNITLEGNNCSLNGWHGIGTGIVLRSSSNNTLSINNCTSNTVEGISLYLSSYNTLSNNTCLKNNFGIYLNLSSNNILADNNCSSTLGTSICLDSSSNNCLARNNCSSNGGIGSGIYLRSSSNNLLTDNNCSACVSGVILYESDDNHLNVNACYWNYVAGIRLSSSSNNVLFKNRCIGSIEGEGISLQSSSNNNTVEYNSCVSNNLEGIGLHSLSNDNTLYNNTCKSNYADGLYLDTSSGNVITLNQLRDNLPFGLRIASGSSSRISNNIFAGNGGSGSTYDPNHVQAFDDGTSNSWNGTGGGGNYWSDWTTPDANHDSIVDLPYNVSGSAGAKDYYPLTAT